MPINQFAKIYPYVDDDGWLLEMEYSADGGVLKLNGEGKPILTTRKLKLNEIGILYGSSGESGLVIMREANPGTVPPTQVLSKDITVSRTGKITYSLTQDGSHAKAIYKIDIKSSNENRTITDILFTLESLTSDPDGAKTVVISCYKNNINAAVTEYEIDISSLSPTEPIFDYRVVDPMDIDYITITFKENENSQTFVTPTNIKGTINISYVTYLDILPSLPVSISNS